MNSSGAWLKRNGGDDRKHGASRTDGGSIRKKATRNLPGLFLSSMEIADVPDFKRIKGSKEKQRKFSLNLYLYLYQPSDPLIL